MKQIKPMPGRVLVLPIDETMAGAIHLPGKNGLPRDCWRATVIAAGDGTVRQPMELRSGDEVLVPAFKGGTAVHLDGRRFMLFKQEEVLAVKVDGQSVWR